MLAIVVFAHDQFRKGREREEVYVHNALLLDYSNEASVEFAHL